MTTRDDAPSDLETLVARETRSAAREATILAAIEDAVAEREEVLSFARDVRQRLTRHPEANSEPFETHLDRIDRIAVPALDVRVVSGRLHSLRVEALRAREALLDAVDQELAASLDAADLALETVREARDFMLRHRQRRTSLTPATVPAPRPSKRPNDDATVVMSAVAGPTTRPSPHATQGNADPERPPRIARALLDEIPGPAAVRQARRRGLETRIDFHGDSNFFSGFSSNISDGGLFIATDSEVPLGTEVDIRFTLPDGMRVECAAIVRWRRAAGADLAAGIGVQFIGLADKARDAVQRFMKQREPIFHEE